MNNKNKIVKFGYQLATIIIELILFLLFFSQNAMDKPQPLYWLPQKKMKEGIQRIVKKKTRGWSRC
jgi:hypothetical protein